jgi:hypothetical protein
VSDRSDLDALVGGDVPEPELSELRRVDELLRATPPPPEVPGSLTAAVLAIPGRRPFSQRRRLLAGVALAAALAAATFGIGTWVGGGSEGFQPVEKITLSATTQAPGAGMEIAVFPVDGAGNWPMLGDAWGLEPLGAGGYYEVWLTRDGKPVASCGKFVVDAAGVAHEVWLNAPYKLKGFDRWVVTAHVPGRGESEPLLDGPVVVPA